MNEHTVPNLSSLMAPVSDTSPVLVTLYAYVTIEPDITTGAEAVFVKEIAGTVIALTVLIKQKQSRTIIPNTASFVIILTLRTVYRVTEKRGEVVLINHFALDGSNSTGH